MASAPAPHLEEQTSDAQGAGQEMLRVHTAKFGEIEVNPEKIITLTAPFLGFPESRRFVLRPHGADSPFMWLQSLDNPELAFVVISPAVINPEYRPPVFATVRDELELEAESDLDLLVILTIPSGQVEQMTANLMGPVAINVRKRLARQVLLDAGRYDLCWPVFSGSGQ